MPGWYVIQDTVPLSRLTSSQGLRRDTRENFEEMSKCCLEEPLFRSSCDTISWILQGINRDGEVTIKAAFAAAIFQRLTQRVYDDPEKEPL
jgi:hypothetical protein